MQENIQRYHLHNGYHLHGADMLEARNQCVCTNVICDTSNVAVVLWAERVSNSRTIYNVLLILICILQRTMHARLSTGRTLRPSVRAGSVLLGHRQVLLWVLVGRQFPVFTRILAYFHLYCCIHGVRFICILCRPGGASESDCRAQVLADQQFWVWHSLRVN